MNSQKTVLVFGTFDRLHHGHRNFFRQAAKLGKVTAVVARDKNIQKIKKRLPLENEHIRLTHVTHNSNIIHAQLGDHSDFLKPIREINPEIIALGFDQKTFTIPKLKLSLKKIGLTPKIIRLKSFQPQKFKSSIFRYSDLYLK